MSETPPVDFVLRAATRYIPHSAQETVKALGIARTSGAFDGTLAYVPLPDWASDLGVGSPASLLVPGYCLPQSSTPPNWESCDWWQACFSHLTCEAERLHEAENGPCHSYAFRLPNTLAPLWDHAWVNRIFLFLRRWATRHAGRPETELFGALPQAEILLTHDVDALQKTLPIRIKALAFDTFNAARLARRGQIGASLKRLAKGIGFFFRRSDYNYLNHIAALEQSYGQVSTFNLHGAKTTARRSAKRYLMDPGYDVTKPWIADALRGLAQRGFIIGVHPSFEVYDDSAQLRSEMDRISAVTGVPVTEIRQHWLRFTWVGTWPAQEEAGLARDTTLGFNDRPGFRNGAAVDMPAWIAPEERASGTLHSLPLLLMDSHLFDYNTSDESARRATIDHWLDGVKTVGGIATVVWHQRAFHPKDYGWGDDYDYLLSRLP